MKKIFILLILLFTLTGCIKNNIDMKLETNNSFNISIINGMQSVGSEYGFTEEQIQAIKDNGYNVEDYEENGYTGIKITYEFDNINSISGEDVNNVELTDLINLKTNEIKLFKREKVEDGYLYTANFTYNLNVEELSAAYNISGGDVTSYSEMMELKYSITLPVKVENSNSTEVNGNTYEWLLKIGEINNINFSFIIKDSDITEEKTDYQKDTKTGSGNKYESDLSKLSTTDIIQSIFGIIVVVALIVLYFKLKKKLLKKKKLKKKNGYHFEAPDSIKEKK